MKFTDAELLGMPWIVTVCPRSLAAGGVEVTERATGERSTRPIDEVEACSERFAPRPVRAVGPGDVGSGRLPASGRAAPRRLRLVERRAVERDDRLGVGAFSTSSAEETPSPATRPRARRRRGRSRT